MRGDLVLEEADRKAFRLELPLREGSSMPSHDLPKVGQGSVGQGS
jgi:hypothetical protein